MKPTLEILIGAPGSGKTSYAKRNICDNTLYVSSDDIRFANLPHVPLHTDVFDTMHQLVRQNAHSSNPKNVIYDATNLSAKKRKHLYKTFHKHYQINTIYFLVPIEELEQRVTARNEEYIKLGKEHLVVPTYAITNLLRSFIPDTSETVRKYDIGISRIGSSTSSYNYILINYYNMSHNSPHHLESIGSHIERCNNDSILTGSDNAFKDVVRYHDLGKFYTGNGFGNFYGHANVSAYLYLTINMSISSDIHSLDIADNIAHHMDRDRAMFGSTILRNLFNEIDGRNRVSLPQNSFEFKTERKNGLLKSKFNINVDHWSWDESLFSDEYFDALDSLLQRRSEVVIHDYKGYAKVLTKGISKCFNIGELDKLPDCKFKTKYNKPLSSHDDLVFYEKLDGSMIQIYQQNNNDELTIHSRGTITPNDYTAMAQKCITPDTKPGIYELTGLTNQHVVQYDYDLKLTQLVDADGNRNKDLIIPPNEVESYLSQSNIEGLIVYCPENDCYYKMKTEEYCNLHYVLSNYSATKLAKYLTTDETHSKYNLDDVLPYLPEFVLNDIKSVEDFISESKSTFISHKDLINNDRKTFALTYKNEPWFHFIKAWDGEKLDESVIYKYHSMKNVCNFISNEQ
jgi:predicted kinase